MNLSRTLMQAAPEPLCVAPASIETFRLAAKVASTNVPVLIQGESGTGKEVVAQYVHARSPRSAKPMVTVNCAAIPENMLETILFGHERGAFTGATNARQGKFLLADQGTLLLDEVSEMPVSLQAKLLRAIQEQEIETLGGKMPRTVDVRILATSNRNLKQAIAEGSFREDLYYRLSVFPLLVMPLRERTEDLWPLAQLFVRKHGSISPLVKGLDPACREVIETHLWPGNVRELENTIQRALVVAQSSALLPKDLGLDLEPIAVAEPISSSTPNTDLGTSLERTEQDLVLQTLEANSGNRKATAAALGVSERTLRYKLARLRDSGVELT